MPVPVYKIRPPRIPSGGKYRFRSDSGMEYEVRFARKKHDMLAATIAFGVLNEEFEEEEYTATNKGEVFRVMRTVVKIVQMYLDEHPNLHTLEFSGEPRQSEDEKEPTTRLRLYARYVQRSFGDTWNAKVSGNKMIITKKR